MVISLKIKFENLTGVLLLLWNICLVNVCCNQNIQWHTDLHRSSKNNGFHREVTSKVEVSTEGGPSTFGTCVLLLIETIPMGAYVDIYQLKMGEEYGGPKVISEYIDIEKPDYESTKHDIYIYGNMTRHRGVISGEVTYPLHLRYHRLRKNVEFAEVTLKHPRVLINCSNLKQKLGGNLHQFPCYPHQSTTCTWKELGYTVESPALTFLVPVGNSNHIFLVTTVTIATTLMGCAYILYLVMKSPELKGKTN
ncbi:unnamed protein product [Owenia fusiformis]|uniref:Phosphatidylinositol-glycan biosynthesis class X protein n=1 Tax=Owenia fusiformis TaxID=6347 RepID=A0A8J1U4W9_OWEFU|nr:unnamed protein product [Owenia fusiformis]